MIRATCRLVFFIAVLAGSAGAQSGAGRLELPKVVNGCFYQKPPSKGGLCQSWVRTGDRFEQIGGGVPAIVKAVHFGDGTATFNVAGGANGDQTYSGKINGNHIVGTVTFGAKELGVSLKWSATFFYPPTTAAGPAGHVYVGCSDKVTIVNTATHTASTVAVNDGGKSIGAMTVSPDGSLLYLTTNDPRWKASLFVIDGNAATVMRKIPLQGTPLASGATSLAISGDASTLYGVGITKTAEIVVMNSSSGAVQSSMPLPKGYSGGQMVLDPRLVVSGSALVMEDGTVVEGVTVPGDPVFGSNSRGLAAFPDGKRICRSGGVIAIGSKGKQSPKGCSAVAPDGVTTFQGNAHLRSDFGNVASNPDFGMVVGITGRDVAISPDGGTIFTAIGASLYSIDLLTHLTTDAIDVCLSPEALAYAPIHAGTGTNIAEATQARPSEQPASAAGDPSAGNGAERVVAEIAGKPITAHQVQDMLKNVPPQVRQQRANDLPRLVQQIYMQHAIAQEAIKLHLDREKPWVDQITQAYGQTVGRFPPPRDNVPPEVIGAYNNQREHILWNAFFTRTGSAEERKALLEQKREAYKIAVLDEGFFKQAN